MKASNFSAPYKMYIFTRGISQPPSQIISHTDAEKFRYDNGIAISVFNLFSYVVGVDGKSSVYYSILDDPPP